MAFELFFGCGDVGRATVIWKDNWVLVVMMVVEGDV